MYICSNFCKTFDVTNEKPCNAIGIMNRTQITVCKKLSDIEKKLAITYLLDAQKQGYDSCIVTNTNVFATKKITS